MPTHARIRHLLAMSTGMAIAAVAGCSSSSASAPSVIAADGGADATTDGGASPQDAGAEGSSPASEGGTATPGIVATIDGMVVRYSVEAVVTPSNGGNYTNFVGYGEDGSRLSVTTTGGAVGTFVCGTNARTAMGYTAPGTITANSLFQNGTCTVIVTEFGASGGLVSGTFTGHLVNGSGSKELTDGSFTLTSP